MTPRLFRKLSGSSSSGGNGSAVLAAIRGLCANLQTDYYYSGNYTLANILIGNGTEGFDNGGIYHDSDLWLQGVPAGLSTVFVRRIVFATNYFPPGSFIVATGQGMVTGVVNGGSSSFMTITQQGADSPTQSVRNSTFTISDLGASGNYSGLILNVTVKAPAAGGLFNCKDLFVGLASDYPAWLAGQTVSGAFMANNAQVKAFKDADPNGMNFGGTRSFSNASQLIPTSRSYQGTGDRSYGTLAKQCKDMGAVYWPVLPYGHEAYLFSCSVANNSITRGDYGGNLVTTPRSVGDAIALYGSYFQDNLVHNGVKAAQLYYIVQMLSANEWRISLTPGGAPITITADFAGNDFSAEIVYVVDPYNLYLAIAQQIKAAYPNGKILPQMSLEPWNGGYPYYELLRQVGSIQGGAPFNAGYGYGYRLCRMWKAFRDARFNRSQILYSVESGPSSYHFGLLTNSALDYISADPDFNPGQSVSQMMDCMSTANYPHPYDSTNTQVGAIELLFQGAINYTPTDWSVVVQRGIDAFVTGYAAPLRAALDAKRPNTPVIMYEGEPSDEGMESQANGLNFMDKPVTAVVTGTPGSLTAATPFGGAWIPGLPITVLSTGTKPAGLTAQPYYYVHSSSTTTALVLCATRGGSALPITSVGSGSISVTVKGQQVLDLATSYLAYKNSSQRATDMAYYLQHIVHDGLKARTWAVYSFTGNPNMFDTTGMRWYSQKRSDGISDNPTTTLLKNYTGWVTTP